MLPYLAAVLIGYLFGCSNMAFYLSRLRGVDIRAHGTGNLGASNTMMLLGWRAGILTGLHDIAKGVLAVWLVRWLFPDAAYIGFAAGAAAVLGHIFPFYLRFKGGKGFATYFGMILPLSWKFALFVVVAGVLLTLITDYIVVATMTTVISFPVFAAFVFGWTAMLIVLIASGAVILRHRENFQRLRAGTEVGFRHANSGRDRLK